MSAFDKIMAGVSEVEKFLDGQLEPAGLYEVKIPDVSVKEVRNSTGQTQADFAKSIGVSVRSIQNWEQGHRALDPVARGFFTILKHDPNALSRALEAEKSLRA